MIKQHHGRFVGGVNRLSAFKKTNGGILDIEGDS